MPDDPFDANLKQHAAPATFTVINHETGGRFTFKVERCEQPDRHSVKVLTGSSYTYLGIIFDGKRYAHGKRSPIDSNTQSAKTFTWLWQRIQTDTLPATIEIYHEPE